MPASIPSSTLPVHAPAILGIGALLGAALSALLVRRMIRIAVLDHPVERSSHTRPTPKGGGVGIIAALVTGAVLLHPALGLTLPPSVAVMLLAVAALSVVSWLDDVHQWPATTKLAAQAACSVIVALACAPLAPGPFLVSFLWLMFVTNAVNFIDGLNGLAAGCCAIGAFAIAWCAPTPTLIVEATALSAGILGFLPFNFPRARIFMGDVGSQGVALALGAMALQALRPDDHGLGLLPAALALGIVLYDVAFTLVRRALAGDALMQAHRGHLYQLAQRSLLPATTVTGLYWVISAWGAWCAATLSPLHATLAALVPLPLWTAVVCRQARRTLTTAW
ncbi:UDP-N-acetylmuramyl pentapeptide phosphotransferase [Ameyamaea chiangmaiensis NBRC 103196]|uniref:UDP-phosphate alpha N-acetylglucosaminyltransferase n=1 Tax=Ameyamaea chiangmaiensis TaxID=442969 RepID=A0A850P8X0_9PROT|nr:UDP-phosphate alpha N-acetylglucosaminyltransferase [Ameyamaea chiangmaiensis]MBS4074359.1 UDP-phosphate alpha N-acetylglucosaminyltransferase [Ameyamaea chiangmaiensis]NVN41027.1 UDP-phosphate alpha N-acetylglucosaminyltransferase [Ameyamaea chiangmaiensis]GBQ71772.1 UDP-N-acetylmuramyl pentapeptide phosphotransferase [Ameyamaea chiangmaiensis NBRC 103196]